MPKLQITVDNETYRAELADTPTAQKLWDALPIQGKANLWGEEIYFEIPVSTQQEPDAREKVEVGTIAYWPAGRAFCIFFGPTPVSTNDQPRAYSPVNILGKIDGDVASLQSMKQGTVIKLHKAGSQQTMSEKLK